MNKLTTNYNGIEEPIQEALSFLGIDGITVTIGRNDRLLDRLAPPDIELEALTTETYIPDTYNMFFRGGKPSLRALAHEMIHLDQLVRGDLKMDLKTGKAWWNGEEYDNSVAYNDRPWEKEAFNKQNEIYKIIRHGNSK